MNTPLPIRDWAADESSQGRPGGSPLHEDPLLLAAHGDFKIIYGRMPGDLSRAAERTIINRLLQNYPYALFVFSDNSQTHWHFVNVKYDRDTGKRRIFRRITVEPGARLRTAVERLSMLDLETVSRDLFGIPPRAIQQRHDQAFDVAAVTAEFFRESCAEAGTIFFEQVRQGRFQLVTSAVVQAEIETAPEAVQNLFYELLPLAQIAAVDQAALHLQQAYIAAGIVSPKWAADALHVALATVVSCPLIVSWNFKHIVHFQKIPLYNAVTTLQGYGSISIYSPREVIRYGDEDI